MLTSNVAQGAAGFAVGLRSKNPDTKQQASSAGLTAVLGITEPVLYGVNLKFTFPLYAAMIGGGLGGLYLGLTRVARFAGGSPGLLVLPAYIPNADVTALGYSMSNLVNAVIGIVIAMASAFLASYFMFGIWAKNGKLDPEELKEAETIPEVADDVIVAVANGKFIGPDEIKDQMFSQQDMGQTVAIDPTDGVISAPANGTIEMMFNTGHAFGLRMNNGMGLLVHIGVDTVNLKGAGFTPLKKKDDKVKAGEPVVKVDLALLKNAGYPAQTMIVITEPLNEDENALGMTMWQKPWAITNVEMLFEDLSNQDKVNEYAANDKWVTLPLNGTTERQKPKTSANNSVYGRAQYEYNTNTKDFYTPGLTGIFKEPVLIMRLMKVTDNGGTTPNLTAQDGTKLTVVKLVENPYLYNNNLVPMINYMLRNNYQQSLIFLDNKPYQSDYKF